MLKITPRNVAPNRRYAGTTAQEAAREYNDETKASLTIEPAETLA